jgi:hypothetical protein
MKVFLDEQKCGVGMPANWQRAFTLVETMVTMGLFSLVVIAFVYTHIFGLKQDQLVQSKLGASDQSRRGFDVLASDIRAAKIWDIGNGNQASFTTIPNGTAQQGNALQLGLTTNKSVYIRYFFNASEGTLNRMHSPANSPITVLARNLTNAMYFRAENHRGNVQTNLTHKGIINVRLEFCQYQYPLTLVGTGYYYDYYKMEFRLTPHVPDGQ